jgi:hypothetical protein
MVNHDALRTASPAPCLTHLIDWTSWLLNMDAFFMVAFTAGTVTWLNIPAIQAFETKRYSGLAVMLRNISASDGNYLKSADK